ncbi:MAG: methylmalonyl-CoA epimerase [Chloroflexi bacterium]|nr:MAG: methylmalonyl-CoA epimerase [Chloroflexota bacterium]MBL1196750.1 methylmalonyl-CoA epimerase [Chloroflexota bacterium]NOH14044.1 methylmalonyl-CoA epimerase [Chloroflexota bacterium]
MSKPKVKKINHVAIVVEDIDEALKFWDEGLGVELSHIQEVPSQESRVAFLPTGESEIELVQPTSNDSGVARYLEKRGPGMHHICVEVEDIREALAHLKEKDIRLINEVPEERDGILYAFIHPESTQGVLVELYELPEEKRD